MRSRPHALCSAAQNPSAGAISGAIWTNTLPAKLSLYLTNQTLATETYASPFTVVPLYPIGTPERDGIVRAYNDVQRLLCITGVCLCVPLLLAALVMRNVKMEDVQSLVSSSTESRPSLVSHSPTSRRLMGDDGSHDERRRQRDEAKGEALNRSCSRRRKGVYAFDNEPTPATSVGASPGTVTG